MFNLDNTYLEKQRNRYESLSGAAALDPLWRAASAAGYLRRHEVSQDQLTPARVADLVKRLGWA